MKNFTIKLEYNEQIHVSVVRALTRKGAYRKAMRKVKKIF